MFVMCGNVPIQTDKALLYVIWSLIDVYLYYTISVYLLWSSH